MLCRLWPGTNLCLKINSGLPKCILAHSWEDLGEMDGQQKFGAIEICRGSWKARKLESYHLQADCHPFHLIHHWPSGAEVESGQKPWHLQLPGDVLFSIALLKLRHFPGCIRKHPCEENEVLQRAYYYIISLLFIYILLLSLLLFLLLGIGVLLCFS